MLTRTRNRAFSLVEMLTVIGILAIVIAIIIPALRGARNAARNADTRVLLKQVGDACSMFQTNERRLPGYFNASQMGDATNTSQFGSTGCENLMLDLIGGITTAPRDIGTGTPADAKIIEVGPGNTYGTNMVRVDLASMGSSAQTKDGTVKRGYFTMDSKRFVAQYAPPATVAKRFGANDHNLLPTLIDPFGQPILAWVQDEIPSAGTFAATDKQTAAPNGARFYWASNAGFLKSTSLGKLSESQAFNFVGKLGSVLGEGNTAANRVLTMEALLGNVASPDSSTPPKPTAPRGPIVMHSAGNDGVYLGLQDRGAKPGFVRYAPNQDPFGGSLFDDIIQAVGH